jgi:hypothetical protein
MLPSSRSTVAALIAAVFTLSSCGGSSPPAPSPPPTQQAPVVTSVAPNSGLVEGGGTITIAGGNFAAGATVTIGGVQAPGVTVPSATTITAAAPPHAAGAVDIVVTVNGLSGTLPAGYTYTTPPAANAPPVITGFVVQDRRPGSPRNFADLEDVVDVELQVQDAETPADQLIYEWSGEGRGIEGSGRRVRWLAPDHYATPADIRLTVTVIERYTGGEHRVPGSTTIALHDSEKEIVDLGYEFLVDFSLQRQPDVVIRNFTDNCRGKADERSDVVGNQAARTIVEYTVGTNPPVTVGFSAVCPYYAPERQMFGDGCAWFPVRWRNIEKADGRTTVTTGFDQVNAVFESGRWRLCDSDFKGATTANGKPTSIRFKK